MIASNTKQVPHVLALGGGFAAIFLYKKLAGQIRRGKLRLTIIDRNNFNCFHGLVPETLAGKIQAGNLLNPLRKIFGRAQFRNGEIEKIDLEQKEVLFSRALDGKEFRVTYDHLVLDVVVPASLDLTPLLLRRDRAGDPQQVCDGRGCRAHRRHDSRVAGTPLLQPVQLPAAQLHAGHRDEYHGQRQREPTRADEEAVHPSTVTPERPRRAGLASTGTAPAGGAAT